MLIDFRRSWVTGTDACISLCVVRNSQQFTCLYARKHTICLVCPKNTHPQAKKAIYVCYAGNYRKGTALVKTESTSPRQYHFTFLTCLCSQMCGMSLDRFEVLSLRFLVWKTCKQARQSTPTEGPMIAVEENIYSCYNAYFRVIPLIT